MVQNGATIRMQFSLRLTDGTVVDETQEGEHLEFTIGDGTLAEGLEERLLDLAVGQKVTCNIDADEAVFGYHDPESVQTLKRDEFPTDMDLSTGNIVSFDLPNGEEVLGTVQEATDDEVKVDFNHPLLGRDFIFEVSLLEIDPQPA